MTAWLTVPQVMAELMVCQRTVYRAIRAGELRAHRFGQDQHGDNDNRRYRIFRDDLNEYIRKCAVVTRRPSLRMKRFSVSAGLMETARRHAAVGR